MRSAARCSSSQATARAQRVGARFRSVSRGRSAPLASSESRRRSDRIRARTRRAAPARWSDTNAAVRKPAPFRISAEQRRRWELAPAPGCHGRPIPTAAGPDRIVAWTERVSGTWDIAFAAKAPSRAMRSSLGVRSHAAVGADAIGAQRVDGDEHEVPGRRRWRRCVEHDGRLPAPAARADQTPTFSSGGDRPRD